MSGGRLWTPEEDNILVEQIAAGKTHAEIGAIVDRTRNAVKLRASHLGATMSSRSAEKNRHNGRVAFYSDAERVAARSAKNSRTFTHERRRALAEKMRGNKRAVGCWDGKQYPASAKALVSAIRTKQWAKAIGVPKAHPLRGLYNDLRKKVGAPEARRILRDEIARLPALEQQMLRLELGAKLVSKIVVPSKSYDVTLGGVT